MGREGKETIVKDLAAKLKKAETTIITNYQGLRVEEINGLRRRLREAGAEYLVVKNSLTRLAVEESQLEELDQFLRGPTAFALASSDPTILAKILNNFSAEHQALQIKGGIFGREVLNSDQVRLWATLPGRGELLTKVTAGIKSPLSNLANILRAAIARLVYVLEAVKKGKGDHGS